MKVQVYGIKNCDSVKKTLRYLKAHAIEYEFIDFKKQKPSQEKLLEWARQVGVEKLLNTRSTTYKTLALKEKDLDDNGKIEWMAKEPLLIKRAVLELPNAKVIVGYDEQSYTRSLL